MAEAPYGEWSSWTDSPNFSLEGFEETLDGGQAFRWNQHGDYFEGRWGSTAVRLRWKNQRVEYAAPITSHKQTLENALANYLATATDFEALTDALPWRSDPVLQSAIEAFPGLRILRQPLPETLFGFLCSSTKQILQLPRN